MKNSPVSILAIACLLLGAFLAGLFLGRNLSGGEIQTSVRAKLPSDLEQPTPSESAALSSTNTAESTAPGRININTADIDTLMKLPGIGEKLAQNIIDYRNSHGPFKDSTELKLVYGIDEKLFNNIKYSITTGG